jgi:hypothetical protein
MKKVKLILAMCLVAVVKAQAAELYEGYLVGRVSQGFDQGELASCGLTVSAIEIPKANAGPNDKLLSFNGAFSLIDLQGGLIKGRAGVIDKKSLGSNNLGPNSIKPLLTESVWFKAPKAKRTHPREGIKLGKSEDPGYVLYASSAESIIGVIGAVHDQLPIHIGMKVKDRKFEEVLYGTMNLSDSDREQFRQCIADWSELARKKLDSAQ